MPNKRDTVYMQGYVYWAKVLGAPRTNYNENGREWTFEFEPNEDGVAELEGRKLGDRLKDKSDKKGYEDRGRFLTLKRKELDYEGKENDPIRIVDAANQPWDGKTEIGNKTLADVKMTIVDYGPGKKSGIYPVAIRVLELVPFVRNDFKPLDDDDPRVKEAKSKHSTPDFEKDFGLEEDAPEEPEVMEQGSPELDDDFPAE